MSGANDRSNVTLTLLPPAIWKMRRCSRPGATGTDCCNSSLDHLCCPAAAFPAARRCWRCRPASLWPRSSLVAWCPGASLPVSMGGGMARLCCLLPGEASAVLPCRYKQGRKLRGLGVHASCTPSGCAVGAPAPHRSPPASNPPRTGGRPPRPEARLTGGVGGEPPGAPAGAWTRWGHLWVPLWAGWKGPISGRSDQKSAAGAPGQGLLHACCAPSWLLLGPVYDRSTLRSLLFG